MSGNRNTRDFRNNRDYRRQIAESVVEEIKQRSYIGDNGAKNNLRIDEAIAKSTFHDPTPADMNTLRKPRGSGGLPRISFCYETTMEALFRLRSRRGRDCRICLMNFASAKNPGGGFLGGSLAQEESIAKCGGLSACLEKFRKEYYDRNRADPRGGFYSDGVIYSPDVPFWRDDSGAYLDSPVLGDVVSVAAVNAGIVRSGSEGRIPQAMQLRASWMMRVVEEQAPDVLVLGAWGCGVFKNDPKQIAGIFRDVLRGYRGEVVFSIPYDYRFDVMEVFKATLHAPAATDVARDDASATVGEGADANVSKSKSASRNERKKKAKENLKANEKAAQEEAPAAATPEIAADSAPPAKALAPATAEEKQKKIRNLQKKLQQIEKLKSQPVSSLNAEQKAKLATEASLLAQIAELN